MDVKGQSIVELILMMPVMIGIAVLTMRVNTAIQVSIVNQQYSRAQALFLTYNSAVYPPLKLRLPELQGKKYNQMLIGISDEHVGASSATPVATSARHAYPSSNRRCADS